MPRRNVSRDGPGNQGRSIFADDSDRKRFLETLAEACEKTGWRVYAYFLMGNHYHLLVRTLRWVAERLQMGQYTRVTKAVIRMNRKPGSKIAADSREIVCTGEIKLSAPMNKCHFYRTDP
ncbi:MAG TPA: transposase, partial [Verrucomicrobiae bacterium]|nr:transposase [Verrucomicrobiae bacterium]